MGETLTQSSHGETDQPRPKWSVEVADFDPTLHLPSGEVINALIDQELHLPEEAKTRLASWGILTYSLQLLNPDVSNNQAELADLKQSVGEAVKYSAKLFGKQHDELEEIYASLAGADDTKPAISKLIDELEARGVDENVIRVSRSAVTTLRIWSINPKAALPLIYNS